MNQSSRWMYVTVLNAAASMSFSQTNFENCSSTGVLGPQSPAVKYNLPDKKPVPYMYVREDDVMWSKRIWRIMDLREKMNLPYYYPLSPTDGRKSLFDVLTCAILNKQLTAYGNPVLDDEFKTPLSVEDVNRLLIKYDTVWTDNPITQQQEKTAIRNEITAEQVRQYWIKEDWYFNKERSTLEVRIVGICPVVENKDENGEVRGYMPLFWIYYPEARAVLCKAETMIRRNNFQRPTYDELFNKRYFASFISKESNVYDRSISEYKLGLDALLEGEKIKEGIRDLESDLWHY